MRDSKQPRFPHGFAWGLAAVVMVAMAAPASAFDDSRRGFVLEFGLGAAVASTASWEYHYENGTQIPSLEQGAGPGLNTRFRVGWGLSRSLLLTYINDVTWTREILPAPYSPSSTTASALTGIGATLFLKPEYPSPLFEAAFGFAGVNVFEESLSESGTGVQLAVGYETARHWALRLSFGRAWLDEFDERTSVAATLSRVWY